MQAWNLGQMGAIYLLADEEDKAWSLLAIEKSLKLEKGKIFKEFGDARDFKEKWGGKAEAFRMANNIFIALNEKELNINKYEALKYLFAGILS